jgi:hypothetical protein
MRERLQKIKKGLLLRAQVTVAEIIAKEKDIARHASRRAIRNHNHENRALGTMTFVSYLFIYGLIPSKFVFVVGEQLLDTSTDLTATMLAVFLTTDKFMALHDTSEWSQYEKFERLLSRVQDLADDKSLSPVSRKAMRSILDARERASHEQYLAEGFYSDLEESDDEQSDTSATRSLCGHGINDEIENRDPMHSGKRMSSCNSDSSRSTDKPDFLNSMPLAKWSAADVSNFLVRNDLEMYVEVFASQRIDGDICYHDLSVDVLKELGVEPWHRGKLVRLFQSLK